MIFLKKLSGSRDPEILFCCWLLVPTWDQQQSNISGRLFIFNRGRRGGQEDDFFHLLCASSLHGCRRHRGDRTSNRRDDLADLALCRTRHVHQATAEFEQAESPVDRLSAILEAIIEHNRGLCSVSSIRAMGNYATARSRIF